MPKKELKLDFLEKKETSPYFIDLRKKEKRKKFSFIPVSILSKTLFIIGIAIFIFSAIFYVKLTIFHLFKLKTELLEREFYNLENFFIGFENLKNFNFPKAEESFNLAKEEFSQGLEKIEKSNFLIKFFLKFYPHSKTAINLLKIFRNSSEIGEVLAKTGQEFSSLIKVEEKEQEEWILPKKISDLDFLEIAEILKEKTILISSLIKKTEKSLSQININYIPFNFQKIFQIIKKEISPLKKNIQDLMVFLENFEKIVGKNSFKRYLILFQNNNEIRATGGFLGTYALIDFANGRIKNFELPAGGSYDLAGWLNVKVFPPSPLLVSGLTWQFHDANWFPNWPTSAKKLIWFYEHSGGSTVDGVIALNAEMISRFLEVVGEISLPDYQKIFNQENFTLEIQKIIEIERKEKKKPKQILVDLTPILLEKILKLEPSKFFKILEIFSKSLKEKTILFYFTDQSIQKFFQEKNLTGEIKETPLDYLMVVNSNVNGAKTEGVISQKISYQAEIRIDGSVISTIKIKRKHQGKKGEVFTGKEDLNWLRVYLPKGAVFLGLQGETKKELRQPKKEDILDEDLTKIEKEVSIDPLSQTRITEEFNKTCFGNFLEIAPGEEKEIIFKYLLPFKLNIFQKHPTFYSLFIQKQPGRVSNFEGEIILPEKRKISWYYPKKEQEETEKIRFTTELETDKIFAFTIE